jgi:tetratricopeptide (TPR) repeat protein
LTVAPGIDPKGPATLIPERTRIIPGRQLPGTPFKIIRLVGEGGMGSVYEAEHVDIGRHVALKVLHPEQCQNPAAVRMFRDEARAATRIGSKYIVEVLDFDELTDGRVMIVMELLDATTLEDALQQAPIDASRMFGILRQAAKGIGSAHAAGIVHRDIKPENIMLCNRDGRSDFVKIVDFGISTIREEFVSDGHVVGTPEYVSPEQAAGTDLDGRSDMYSLACTAYRAFAGRPPFQGQTLFDLLTQHLTVKPKPLSAWRKQHGCPPQLEAVLIRALSKQPEDRYENMADFEAALCEAQIAAKVTTAWDDLELPDVELSRRERLLKNMPGRLVPPMPRRTRYVLGGTLAAVLSASAAAFVVSRPEPPPAPVEVDQTVQRIVNAARAAGAKAYYVYPPVDDADHRTAYQRVLELEALEGDQAEAAQQQAATLRAEFAAALQRVGDWLYEQSGGKSFAVDYYVQALMFDPESSRRDRVYVTAGELAEFRRKASEGGFTREELEAAQPLAEMQAAMDPPAVDASEAEAEPTKAEKSETEKNRAYRRLLRRKSKLLTAEKAEIDQALVEAGGTVDMLADADDSDAGPRTGVRNPDTVADEVAAQLAAAAETNERAESRSKQPTDASTSTPRRADPAKVKELLKQASAAHRSGNRREAARLYRQVVDLDQSNDEALIALSDISFDAGNYRTAIRFGERAVRIAPRNGSYRVKLGDAYYKRVMLTEARAEYQRALEFSHPDAARKLAKVEAKLAQ